MLLAYKILMGVILGSKVTNDGKVIFTISLDREEALQLKGHITNINVFSDHLVDVKTNLSTRGRNESTKYFLIPTQLRKNLKFNGEVRCQRLDSRNKTIFVYVVDKF